MQICNNKSIIIEYQDHLTKVRKSTLHRILLGRGKIQLRLRLDDNSKSLILNLHNIYYLPNSFFNLVSLGLFNNSNVYHDNKYKGLYQVGLWKTLAQAKCWRNSFLINPLNLSNGAMYMLRVNIDTHQPLYIFLISTSLLSSLLSIWYKRLGHLNFSLLKLYFN